MNFFSIALAVIFLSFSVIGIIYGLSLKNKWVLLFSTSLLIKLGIIAIFQSGMHFFFVLDSLKYDQDAWFMAKSWIASEPEVAQSITQNNLYTQLTAVFYYLFGRDQLMPTLFNLLCGVACIYVVIKTIDLCFSDKIPPTLHSKITFALALGLSLYPSFTVWTTTNTKDPLTTLLVVSLVYFFSFVISTKKLLAQFFALAISVPLLFALHGLRPYFAYLLLGGFALFVIINFLLKKLSPRQLFLTSVSFSITTLYTISYLFPDYFSQLMAQIINSRLSFTNAGLVDAAQSSFLLNYTFASPHELILFIPQALLNYLFGPFFWNVQNIIQTISLIEPLAIALLLVPTVRGIKAAYRMNKTATIYILSTCFIIALAQAVIISNMGTVFRHRAIVIIMMFIFTAIGFYEKVNERN